MRTIIVCACLLIGGAGTARGQETSGMGGSGGTKHVRMCPEGSAVTQIVVAYGMWIDKISGSCQEINMVDGSWGGSQLTIGLGSLGKEHLGNTSKFLSCGSGHAVKGFRGEYGSFVHKLTVHCHKLMSGGRTQSSIAATKTGGTEGPNEGGPYVCPENKPALGIWGKDGEYVDRFGLVCGYIMPATPALLTPANNADVVTRRPTLDWDDTPRINMKYKVCLNLSSGASCSVSGTVRADVSASTWTPSSDLPFARGDQVYWRVDACNDNGCKSAYRSFRYLP